MNLHPYDGQERRFRHTDADLADGLTAVAHLLRLPEAPSPDGLFYDLSFYSGEIGVLDRLALTLPADPHLWKCVADALCGKTREQALQDPAWADDLLWMLLDEDESLSPQNAVHFINARRQEFQPACDATSRLLFSDQSNVNDWTALWGDDSRLNYLGYSQG